MSHFQKQITSQFFQTFVLNFPPQDPGWSLDGEVDWVEKRSLCSVEHLRVAHFYEPQYSQGGFQGHSTQLAEKQTKTIVSNTERPSTIGTTELLSREQIDT